MSPTWSKRSGSIPGAVGLSTETFREIDELISALRTGSREWGAAMDLGAQALAMASKGIVQSYYRGVVIRPQDARRVPSTFAIPVRRVTQATYKGWRTRRIAPGVWELFNEERGAYMVEKGIYRGGNGGRRRPVLKMSAVATLRFVQRSRFGNRIMAETFGNLRTNKGHFRSFSARMAGSNILGIAGPVGYLP